MGGIAILVAVVAGYVLGHVATSAPFTRSAALVLAAMILAGAVGAADDWIKVSRRRSLGLNKRWKTIGLVSVAVGFCIADVNLGGAHTTLSFTRWDVPGLQLGAVVWVIWGSLIILATANAVNLTDGLDGLAAGSSSVVLRLPRPDRIRGVPAPENLWRPLGSRPRSGRSVDGRRVRGLPVVERRPGPDHHG